MTEAEKRTRAKEYGYVGMCAHVLLTLFLSPIWIPIWVYKVTKATNKIDNSQDRTPVGAMLLYIFIPFYWIFWQYTVANMLDKNAGLHGENADNGAVVLICAFLLPIVNIFLIQHRLNRESMWEVRNNARVPVDSGAERPTLPADPPVLPGGSAFEMPSLVLAAQNGVIVPIEKPVMLIGRSHECDIHFREDASDVSRRHCRLEHRGDQLLLTDLGSSCGTFLHGQRLTPNVPVQIWKGDTFTLGRAGNSFTVG